MMIDDWARMSRMRINGRRQGAVTTTRAVARVANLALVGQSVYVTHLSQGAQSVGLALYQLLLRDYVITDKLATVKQATGVAGLRRQLTGKQETTITTQ